MPWAVLILQMFVLHLLKRLYYYYYYYKKNDWDQLVPAYLQWTLFCKSKRCFMFAVTSY